MLPVITWLSVFLLLPTSFFYRPILNFNHLNFIVFCFNLIHTLCNFVNNKLRMILIKLNYAHHVNISNPKYLVITLFFKIISNSSLPGSLKDLHRLKTYKKICIVVLTDRDGLRSFYAPKHTFIVSPPLIEKVRFGILMNGISMSTKPMLNYFLILSWPW